MEVEGPQGFILDRRVPRLVSRPVAHVLHDNNRAIRAAKVLDVFQPVGESVVAEGQAAVGVLACVLGLPGPHQQEERPGAA